MSFLSPLISLVSLPFSSPSDLEFFFFEFYRILPLLSHTQCTIHGLSVCSLFSFVSFPSESITNILSVSTHVPVSITVPIVKTELENRIKFKEWMGKEWGKYVEMEKEGTKGWGVRTCREVKEYTEFISVPKRLMFTTEKARKTEYGLFYKQNELTAANPSIVLSMHLAMEVREKKSFWKPYFDMLPKIPNIPLLYNQQELSMLKGTNAYFLTLNLIRNVTRNYVFLYSELEKARGKLGLKGHLLLAEWFWAVAIVMSRQNPLPNNELGLVPLWDFCNHRDDGFISLVDVETGAVSCSTGDCSLPSDTPVFIKYGNRTNLQLFVYMGFISSPVAMTDMIKMSAHLRPEDSARVCLDMSLNERFFASFLFFLSQLHRLQF